MRKIGVKVAKNRMGKEGVVVMRFDGDHMVFYETDEEYKPKKKRQGGGRDQTYDADLPWV